MVEVNVVGVVTLISEHGFAAHLGIHIGIFAIVFVKTRPCGVAGKVDGGVIGPGYHGGTRLVGADLGGTACETAVEGSTHVQVLREECAAHAVGGAVVLVQTVKVGSTGIFHRCLLDVLQQACIEFGSLRLGVGGIQHRTNPVVPEYAVDGSLAPHPTFCRTPGIVGKAVDVQFAHLPDLLLKGHCFQVLLDALLNLCIGRNGLCMAHSQSGEGKRNKEKSLFHGFQKDSLLFFAGKITAYSAIRLCSF